MADLAAAVQFACGLCAQQQPVVGFLCVCMLLRLLEFQRPASCSVAHAAPHSTIQVAGKIALPIFSRPFTSTASQQTDSSWKASTCRLAVCVLRRPGSRFEVLRPQHIRKEG